MKSIFTYIFKNNYYNDVISKYDEIRQKYLEAYKIWSKYHSVSDNGKFETKEIIASAYSEIKQIDSWKCTYNYLERNMKEGLKWFSKEKSLSYPTITQYQDLKLIFENRKEIENFDTYWIEYNYLERNKKEGLKWFSKEKSLSYPTTKQYQDLKLIFENKKEIENLDYYWNEYNILMQTDSEAIRRFTDTYYTYNDIKNIALNRTKIKKISSAINKGHDCESQYKEAWRVFSNGRTFENISYAELSGINKEYFAIKEEYLRHYKEHESLIKLIYGKGLLAINSFTEQAIEQEKEIIKVLTLKSSNSTDLLKSVIHIQNETELKRAILNSEQYGNKCNFTSNFTIADFYEYRKQFDEIGVAFDDAVSIKCQNENAIKSYNSKKYGKAIVYISDYYDICIPTSDLSNYVNDYNNQQELRNKAKSIKSNYSKGFAALWSDFDLDVCDISQIQEIINNSIKIKDLDNEIIYKEKLQEEARRKQMEEERRKEELVYLLSCVFTWFQPTRSSLKCFSLFYYYPTNCDWNASEDEWEVRNLIWDFKANPNRPQSESEIRCRHERAMNKVLPLFKKVMSHYFGSNTSKLTLVCIPSSKKIVTERRYKDFSYELCSITGMDNGYDYISVLHEGEAKHLGGTTQAQISIDGSFFRDRYIVLLDDVITSGKSMEMTKNLLEQAGAHVIAGLSIGRTKHEREYSNPIDNL